MLNVYENFVAIFKKQGTNVEEVKRIFKDKGATKVQVSYDYITIDDDPNMAVSFFIEGMTWTQSVACRLEMGLKSAFDLPESHYICVDRAL